MALDRYLRLMQVVFAGFALLLSFFPRRVRAAPLPAASEAPHLVGRTTDSTPVAVAHSSEAVAATRKLPLTSMPRLLSSPVEYPKAEERTESVVLEVLVGTDGSVKSCRVVSGQEPFAAAALKASERFVFTPAQLHGEARAVLIRMQVRFVPPADTPSSPVASNPVPTGIVQAAVETPRAAETEVQVFGERADFGLPPTPTRSLKAEEVRVLPGAFGDALRAIELLPSMVPVVSGLPYFYLRGAPPGNTAYFFDEIPVPYLFHFAAGPSIIHSEMLSTVTVYGGSTPAPVGGFAGGAIIGQLAPFSEKRRLQATLRLIDGSLLVETPFADGKGKVAVAARYAYPGLAISLVNPDLKVRYWDYQMRSQYKLNSRDRFSLSWFGAADKVRTRPSRERVLEDAQLESIASQTSVAPEPRKWRTDVDVQFHRLDLRWDHTEAAIRTRVGVMGGYDRSLLQNGEVSLTSPLFALHADVERTLSKSVTWRVGARLDVAKRYQTLKHKENYVVSSASGAPASEMTEPNVSATPDSEPAPAPVTETNQREDVGGIAFPLGFGSRWDTQTALYTDFVAKLSSRVTVTPGVRVQLFSSGKQVEPAVDPRLHARFRLGAGFELFQELGLVHQAPAFPIPAPGVNPRLSGGLQCAVHHAAGVEFINSKLNASATLFQNYVHNATDLLGALGDQGSGEARYTGHAYGFELFARAELLSNLHALASYTLSRSEETLARYHGLARFDRSHLVNGALLWTITEKWSLGARGVFYSNNPTTLNDYPTTRIRRGGPFWRVDWRLEKRWLLDSGGDLRLMVEVQNTTLNQESQARACATSDGNIRCVEARTGPVTIPSLGLELRL